MDRDGGNQRPLIPDQELEPGLHNWAPAWSPNGDIIAYQSNYSSDLHVCFVSIEGQALGCYSPGWSTALPSWSPDGQQLTFIGREDGDWDVFIAHVSLVDSQVELVNVQKLTDTTSVEQHPRISPDSQNIVFTSNVQGTYDIMVIHPDGTNIRVVASTEVDEVMPSWLGNHHVLYTRQVADMWEIVVVDIYTGQIETIKPADALNKWPVWCEAN
jgi:TolB protein